MGYRFQANCKTLPGKPDVLYPPKRRLLSSFMDAIGMGMIVAVIMLMPVNPIKHIGDPSIERTKQRDQEYIQALEADGWKVIVLWECEIRKDLDGALGALIAEL